MKWIVSCFTWILMGLPGLSFAQNALLQVGASHQQDTTSTFSGIEGLEVKRLETKLNMPVLVLATYAGDWFAAGQFSENRWVLSGTTSATRRFYRFSLPIEYEASSSGRWQHFWRFAPSYYSDESLIDQNRYVNEYAWQVKYQANRKLNWVVGLRQDTLFGSTQMYPVFGLEARPNRKIFHHWVFPNIYSEINLKKDNSLRLFMTPDGGNWRYREEDGSIASFGMTRWKVGAALLKPLKTPLQLKLEFGLTMMGEGSIAGVDGDLSDGYFFLVGIESRLPE
jgi:hypothetical protein